MNFTTYELDIAKRVFQLYWVDHESVEICNRKLGKQDLLAFFAQRETLGRAVVCIGGDAS